MGTTGIILTREHLIGQWLLLCRVVCSKLSRFGEKGRTKNLMQFINANDLLVDSFCFYMNLYYMSKVFIRNKYF